MMEECAFLEGLMKIRANVLLVSFLSILPSLTNILELFAARPFARPRQHQIQNFLTDYTNLETRIPTP